MFLPSTFITQPVGVWFSVLGKMGSALKSLEGSRGKGEHTQHQCQHKLTFPQPAVGRLVMVWGFIFFVLLCLSIDSSAIGGLRP